MKHIRVFAFFLFVIVSCTSYGNENKYVFLGQKETNGLVKATFLLELIGDEPGEHIQISENGELYLKVDKIIAIPKDALSSFTTTPNSNQQAMNSFLSPNQLNQNYDELEILCRNCRFYYTPRPGHRNCPRCGAPN